MNDPATITASRPRNGAPRTGRELELTFAFRYTPEYLKAVNSPEVTAPVADPVTDPVAGQVTEQVTEQVTRLLPQLDSQTLSAQELMVILELAHRPSFLYTYLQPALAAGLIERTLPDKPNSRLQKYRLTVQGRAWLSQHPH